MSISKVIPIGLILVAAGVTAPATSNAQTPGVREVTASPRTLIQLQTRLRYTTMIVLPEGEEILDVVCGDKDFWVVNATQNMAHVKPAKEGSSTNLNLVTGSGAVYSFLLTEKAGGTPDLKVYVNADPSAPKSKPKFYSAAQVEEIQSELTQARAAVEAAARHANDEITAYQQQYPGRLQFTYGTPKSREAVPRQSHLERRAIHLHQGRGEGITRGLRNEGRRSSRRQLSSPRRHIRRAEGPRAGVLALGKERFPFQQGR